MPGLQPSNAFYPRSLALVSWPVPCKMKRISTSQRLALTKAKHWTHSNLASRLGETAPSVVNRTPHQSELRSVRPVKLGIYIYIYQTFSWITGRIYAAAGSVFIVVLQTGRTDGAKKRIANPHKRLSRQGITPIGVIQNSPPEVSKPLLTQIRLRYTRLIQHLYINYLPHLTKKT